MSYRSLEPVVREVRHRASGGRFRLVLNYRRQVIAVEALDEKARYQLRQCMSAPARWAQAQVWVDAREVTS